MANCKPRSGLLANVYAKIEQDFGLDKTFTHWDFDEFLGKDKTQDRNRIAVRFSVLLKRGVFKKVGDIPSPTNKGNVCRVYKALVFPISVACATALAEEPGLDSRPKLDLDSLFFNLGRKPHERINIRKGESV
jgi:hypothetical protein